MADGAFPKVIRRLIPRRLRWLVKAAFKRITGLYHRDIMARQQDMVAEQRDITGRLDAIQHQVTVALPAQITSRLDAIQHQATIVLPAQIASHVDAIQHQASVVLPAQIEAQAEVMDLLLRRLRLSGEEIAAHLGTLEERIGAHLRAFEEETVKDRRQTAALTGTVNLVQAQVALLRAHLYASGILGPVTLKTKALQRVFEEATANTPQEAAAVEIGCIRYPFESPLEGASTLYFARWCRDANRKFVSIDVQREHVENAKRLLDEQGLTADLIHADGQEAISGLSVPIGLLYLDGSNDPNETLQQFKAAEDKLAVGAIVAIDDVQQIDSDAMGKGESTIPYAGERGWKVQVLNTDPGYRMAVLRRPTRARSRQ